MAVMTATTATAQPDNRSGVDHRAGPGYQHRPDYRFNNHDRRHQPHPQAVWRGNEGWVLPALLFGGLLAIEASRPTTVIVEQPITNQVRPYGQYRYVNAYDESCACWKQVIIPIE